MTGHDVCGCYIDRVQLTAFWNESKTSDWTPHGRAVDCLCDHCRSYGFLAKFGSEKALDVMSRMYWATERYMVDRYGLTYGRTSNDKTCVLLAVAEIESDLHS